MLDLASIYADLHQILEPYAVILDAKRHDDQNRVGYGQAKAPALTGSKVVTAHEAGISFLRHPLAAVRAIADGAQVGGELGSVVERKDLRCATAPDPSRCCEECYGHRRP